MKFRFNRLNISYNFERHHTPTHNWNVSPTEKFKGKNPEGRKERIHVSIYINLFHLQNYSFVLPSPVVGISYIVYYVFFCVVCVLVLTMSDVMKGRELGEERGGRRSEKWGHGF